MNDSERETVENLTRLTASAMQTLPPELMHLLPDGYTIEEMADWLTTNQSILAAMTARHIAIERGYLKPPPMDTP
jgi:hypothetical protein